MDASASLPMVVVNTNCTLVAGEIGPGGTPLPNLFPIGFRTVWAESPGDFTHVADFLPLPHVDNIYSPRAERFLHLDEAVATTEVLLSYAMRFSSRGESNYWSLCIGRLLNQIALSGHILRVAFIFWATHPPDADSIVNEIDDLTPLLQSSIDEHVWILEQRSRAFRVDFSTYAESGGGAYATEDCAVCFNVFWDEEDTATLPCGHIFHWCCIAEWIATRHTCPLCRMDVR